MQPPRAGVTARIRLFGEDGKVVFQQDIAGPGTTWQELFPPGVSVTVTGIVVSFT